MFQRQFYYVAFVLHRGLYARRARLTVPQAELFQIQFSPILDGTDKILACRRFAIVAVEIEVSAFSEPLRPSHCAHHANHFCALVIDCGGIEIADLAITVRSDWVRQRARILGELCRAQDTHIFDPLHCFALHILAEQLIAQDSKSFLQRQLEPIAAGHTVA